jgi:ATP-dependent Zn protease
VRTRFSDVWGQDAVLGRIKENMLFLENPEIIEKRGGHVPGGILLWGPPGTGKTLMAEAVAGETGKPYVFVEPGAFINMFMGVGIIKVKSLFRKLRKFSLKYGGVITFMDEVDSLGNRGQQVTGLQEALHDIAGRCHGAGHLHPDIVATLAEHEAALRPMPEAIPPKRNLRNRIIAGMGMGGGGMGTLEALLSEISGLKKPRGFLNRYVRRAFNMRPKPPPNYRILIIMATNMPQALDPALLRPGRIDRIYRVGYPTKAGRIRTYEGYFSKISHQITAEQMDKLATITPYATGASIKDMVNESLIQAIRDRRETVTWRDVLTAKNLKALGPSRDMELVPHDRHGVAIHEACHAMVAYRAYSHLQVDLATIDPGSDYLGMVMNIPIEDRHKQFKSEYEASIMVSLASLAGERMFFSGDSASGVSGDLDNATRLAILMEGFWGMGDTLAAHGTSLQFQSGPAQPQGRNPNSGELLSGGLGDRVEKNLQRLMRHVEDMLRVERTNIFCLAHALETHKTLSGDDVVAVIERTQGPLADGTAYADPAFVARIERYHDEMVAAHRAGRSGGEVAFPSPPLAEPVMAGAAYEAPAVAPPSYYVETVDTVPAEDEQDHPDTP